MRVLERCNPEQSNPEDPDGGLDGLDESFGEVQQLYNPEQSNPEDPDGGMDGQGTMVCVNTNWDAFIDQLNPFRLIPSLLQPPINHLQGAALIGNHLRGKNGEDSELHLGEN